MRLTIDRDALFAALTRTAGVVSRRGTIPILQHVMLVTGDGEVTATTTNLDIQATISVPARIETPGSTTIAAERLREICARLPEGAEIAIDATDPLRASIKAGRSKFSVGALPAKDFPLLNAPEGGSVLELPAGVMLRLLTIGSASMGELSLACFNLEREGDVVRAVSSDKARLTFCDVQAPDGFTPKDGTLLSPETATILLRALGTTPPTEPASLTVLPGKMIAASIGGLQLVARVLDAKFAPYKRVLALVSGDAFTVDTGDLIAMLNRARIAGDHLFVDVSKGAIAIRANDMASGDSSEDFGECDWEGPDRRLSISAPNLLGVLEYIRTESTVFRLGGAMTPISVGETGESDWLGLVMPLVGSK